MTSFHKPNSRVVICGDLSRTGRTKPLELGFVLPMLGAAASEQFTRLLHRGSERTGRVMPVQNNSRRFNRAPGNPITRTARVIACRHSRVSFGVSHFVSPVCPFQSLKPRSGRIPHGNKVTARGTKLADETGSLTARGGNG